MEDNGDSQAGPNAKKFKTKKGKFKKCVEAIGALTRRQVQEGSVYSFVG